MGDRGRGSAVAGVASNLANQGSGVALTGGGGEKPGGGAAGEGGEALGDLFGVLDEEVAGFVSATIAAPVKRGPGRPPGSPNRTTLQLQRYLQARGYRDPAEFLASLVSMDTRALAAALRGPVPPREDGEVPPVGFGEALAALELQRKAASDLMPYFHQRMPQQVEHRGEGARPLIIIHDAPAGGAVRPSGGVMSVYDEIEAAAVLLSDQGLEADVGASDPGRSHVSQSHDAHQVIDDKG